MVRIHVKEVNFRRWLFLFVRDHEMKQCVDHAFGIDLPQNRVSHINL